jgi:hypothetical protein
MEQVVARIFTMGEFTLATPAAGFEFLRRSLFGGRPPELGHQRHGVALALMVVAALLWPFFGAPAIRHPARRRPPVGHRVMLFRAVGSRG